MTPTVNLDNVPTVLDVPFYGEAAQSGWSATYQIDVPAFGVFPLRWTAKDDGSGTARAEVAGCTFLVRTANLDIATARFAEWIHGIDW